MGLPRTFIGFSDTDIEFYRLMQNWNQQENMRFDFVDCQLTESRHSNSVTYVKSVCRSRMTKADKYLLLIGSDTRSKNKYVRWEVEVALEKGCTIIGVNLNGLRYMNPKQCPPVINNIGSVFISFSPQIVAHALQNYKMASAGNYKYTHSIYKKLGYGVTA